MSHPLLHLRHKTLYLLPLLLTTLLLGACSKPEPAEQPIRAVKLMTVGASTQQASIDYAGVVTARTETALGFRVAGKLLERPATTGQHVSTGQLLARLDAADYQLALTAAQAQVRAATTDRDLQAADVKRYRELRTQNFISSAELDRREAGLRAAQAKLEEAKAQLSTQDNQTDYTRLTADASGIITATLAEPGQVVAAGTPIVRIALDGARDVSFSVPEQRLSSIQVGQPVSVRTWANGAAEQPARVREVAAAADAATRTFSVKVEVLAEEQPPLGATVTVNWPQPNHGADVLRLPGTAIWRNPQGENAVWIYDAGTSSVRSRAVQLGQADGNDWVIQSGLEQGEQIVMAGTHVLTENEKVTVYQQPGQRSEPTSAPQTNGTNGGGPQA